MHLSRPLASLALCFSFASCAMAGVSEEATVEDFVSSVGKGDGPDQSFVVGGSYTVPVAREELEHFASFGG